MFLVFLMVDGVEIEDFAVAQAGSAAIYGVLFVIFVGYYVWRRWLPKMIMKRSVGSLRVDTTT